MRENGQIYRSWKKWGSELSNECLKQETTEPMHFEQVTMAFAIFLGASTMALAIFMMEWSIKRFQDV